MKLATLGDGTRDGTLVVVDRALRRCVTVPGIARTLQEALDRWSATLPLLTRVATSLEQGEAVAAFDFNPAQCRAPLPRAHHWSDASAYVNHVDLVRRSRGERLPASYWTDPLMYQGGSDDLQGPHDPALFIDESHGIDLEAELAVITDDVPMGISSTSAPQRIALLTLVNDWSLRHLIAAEVQKGFGFLQGKPSTAFAPVAVTPDELGNAWRDCKVHLPVVSHVNGTLLGRPDAGTDMTFNFAQLIAHATRTRRLGAGAIIGSGTVSNLDRSRGSACLIEKRMLEKLATGEAATPFLRFGDRVRIEVLDDGGNSVFGAIEQEVLQTFQGDIHR